MSQKQQNIQEQLVLIKKSREELKKAKADYKIDKKDALEIQNAEPAELDREKKRLADKKLDI